MHRSEHPSEKDLALLAGGDTGRWRRFTLGRHVDRCSECQAKLAEYRDLRAELVAADELPGVNWSSLEAEMRANIHVGFEAGECVREARAGRSWNWPAWKPLTAGPRLAMAVACLLVVACAGYFLRRSVDGIFGVSQNRAQMAARNLPAAGGSAVGVAAVGVAAGGVAAGEDAVLESSNTGLELRSGGGSLMLLSHQGAIAHQTVSAEGEIRARYVDGEAGTVTINNVYLQ